MDGSEGAAAAARWAVREGELRQIPVTAVVAWDYLNQALPSGEEFDPQYSEEDALGLLRAWVASAVGPALADTVGRISVCDFPWRALTGVSVEADLLVVGARGTGGFLGLRIGSVSERVLEHASCPVAVIHVDTRKQDAPAEERIVVGVDGSVTATRALAWALDEARARHAKVHLVSAWSVPIMVYPGAMEGANIFEGAAEEIIHDAVRDADVHGLAHPITCETTAGGAASALIDAAGDATLVVVGSRGLSRARELLFGSVSHQVVHHAPCPVVVIRPDQRGEK
jgi:nucleotide-binding universal stress UspA family protein